MSLLNRTRTWIWVGPSWKSLTSENPDSVVLVLIRCDPMFPWQRPAEVLSDSEQNQNSAWRVSPHQRRSGCRQFCSLFWGILWTFRQEVLLTGTGPPEGQVLFISSSSSLFNHRWRLQRRSLNSSSQSDAGCHSLLIQYRNYSKLKHKLSVGNKNTSFISNKTNKNKNWSSLSTSMKIIESDLYKFKKV